MHNKYIRWLISCDLESDVSVYENEYNKFKTFIVF